MTDGSTQDLEFTYDEVGNVLSRFDDLIDETETFTYDYLNRLKTSQVTGESTVTMNYSAAGRIRSKSDVGGLFEYEDYPSATDVYRHYVQAGSRIAKPYPTAYSARFADRALHE